MLLIEGLRSLQRPTYLQTPIEGHHQQLRSLDLVGQLTISESEGGRGKGREGVEEWREEDKLVSAP